MIKGVKKEITEEIVKEVKNAPKIYDNTVRTLLIDADSIIYTSTYFPEDSLMDFPTIEEKIEEAKFRVRNKIQEIQNNVEEWFNISNTFMFVSGKKNFRYKIFPEYKLNRRDTEKSPLLPIIKEYMIEELNAIPSQGAEADDYIIDAVQRFNYDCVVSSIDKDVLYYCPNIPVYSYKSHKDILGEWKFITSLESRMAIASQIIIGDSTDGVPGAVGIGPKYCEKNLHENMTNYQFIKAILLAYLKSNKNDMKKSKTQIKLYYKVLKLYTLKEIRDFYN